LHVIQRTRTLLKEYRDKDRVGGIIDRRFGENDPTMTPEERMLERFTRERQRESKGALFNLEDEDELTHYGQSLSRLDDFDNVGLELDDEDDEEGGQIDSRTVRKVHFGGFESEEDDDNEGVSETIFSKLSSLTGLFTSLRGGKQRPKPWLKLSQRARSIRLTIFLNVSSVSLKRLSSSTSVRCNKKMTRTSDINLIKTWNPYVHCSTPSTKKGLPMKQR
jgi:hypothetical protein